MRVAIKPEAFDALCGAQKKPYVAPALVHYGRVRDLTQAGASGQTEGSIGSQQCISERHANGPCTSDRKLKENIVRLGDHPMGFGLYLFDYTEQHKKARGCAGCSRRFGVMADEVEGVFPSAVVTDPNGFKAVHYGMLGIDSYARKESGQ